MVEVVVVVAAAAVAVVVVEWLPPLLLLSRSWGALQVGQQNLICNGDDLP